MTTTTTKCSNISVDSINWSRITWQRFHFLQVQSASSLNARCSGIFSLFFVFSNRIETRTCFACQHEINGRSCHVRRDLPDEIFFFFFFDADDHHPRHRQIEFARNGCRCKRVLSKFSANIAEMNMYMRQRRAVMQIELSLFRQC